MDPSGERVSAEEAGAFVQRFSVAPTAPGALSGLTFAVKDLIDIAGRKSGCGNPNREKTHAAAAAHAVCVEQLLAAGARCVGKTVTDELAFSLIGDCSGAPLGLSLLAGHGRDAFLLAAARRLVQDLPAVARK